MPKSRSKVRKTIVSSMIVNANEHDLPVGCCSNRNCPSHWHDRLTEKWKTIQQSKTSSATIESKPSYRLVYPDILLKLFPINNNLDDENHEEEEEIYSKPIVKSVVLNKHNLFLHQLSKRLHDSTYTFSRNDLNLQFNYRMISLGQVEIEPPESLKINLLRINHIHHSQNLALKIVSIPIWNRLAVHVIVQDENMHCIRLSIYNWSYVIDTRQSKSLNYVQERLKNLLPINSSIILLDPWLKRCHDGDISLRCESPMTNLILIDYDQQCSITSSIDIEQLRQLGNACYQADDSLSAIEYYTFGLKQLDEQKEKELALKGQTIGPKNYEREQHRIRFLANRCACYLRERQATLALADTALVVSVHDLSYILSSPKSTAGKVLFRCLNAHLQLGLYSRAETVLRSYQFSMGSDKESLLSKTILEKELDRLRNETKMGSYDLLDMFNEQVNNKSSMMFIDLAHHHAECRRDDLFEVRTCQENTLGYPKGSYGVYALKDLDVGTLLLVEQPFASIDHRVHGEEYSQSINAWKSKSKIDYCSNDILRLLNEIEKQCLIGHTTSYTFERIQSMQPIRQWLKENVYERFEEPQVDVLAAYEVILSDNKYWRRSSTKRLSSPPASIPWRVLFQTQQQNPYRSQSTLGWYPVGSMFNHSCLPNCMWYLIGDYLFIYICASNVRQGEELTISYCPLWISSIQERTNLLRQYEIDSCQCVLCSYDRSVIDEYEIELKKFSNLRALTRQKNSENYFPQLNEQYEILIDKFQARPIGFINEFLDIESISKNFSQEIEPAFLERLARIFRITLPDISNPLFLFGPQLPLLIHHLEQSPSSSELEPWYHLLNYLFDIYTFKCYSDQSKSISDHKQFYTNLFQTQSLLIHASKT